MPGKEFLTLTDIEDVINMRAEFSPLESEAVFLENCHARVTSCDIYSEEELPAFSRSTVDGYAVKSASTFGSSDGNPSCLNYIGKGVDIGKTPDFSIRHGDAAKIPTGGMIPDGSDAVVMIEHADMLGDDILEVFRPVAPFANIISRGDDVKEGELVIPKGTILRAQEIGVLAALGKTEIMVTRKPVIGIISTGDEIVPADQEPEIGQIRDVNTHTLMCMVRNSGAEAVFCGLVKDSFEDIHRACERALEKCDILVISGGSSVGARDYTLDIVNRLSDGRVLVKGVSMSPGKPVILGKTTNKQIWGLPGHVASAMIVFYVLVKPFINRHLGIFEDKADNIGIPAILSKNVASANGRTDFIRVKLRRIDGKTLADPVIGKSGLLFTLLKSDGIIKIPKNCEGLNQGSIVDVLPFGQSF